MADAQHPIIHLCCNAHIDPVWRYPQAHVSLEASTPRQIDFKPYEINTFKVRKDGRSVTGQETALLEE